MKTVYTKEIGCEGISGIPIVADKPILIGQDDKIVRYKLIPFLLSKVKGR